MKNSAKEGGIRKKELFCLKKKYFTQYFTQFFTFVLVNNGGISALNTWTILAWGAGEGLKEERR